MRTRTCTEIHHFQPGDKVRYGVTRITGIVVQNHGPRINSTTGNDVITWADAPNYVSQNVHDASELHPINETPVAPTVPEDWWLR